tara:strand:- start:1887 stop:2051 length:165 start_codon:yes stop_codon:yes gene_type:complete
MAKAGPQDPSAGGGMSGMNMDEMMKNMNTGESSEDTPDVEAESVTTDPKIEEVD